MTPTMETLRLSLSEGIARIEFNRPDKANAINARMWQELREAMRWLDEKPAARVGILCAAGRHFSAGLDLDLLVDLKAGIDGPCGGRARERLRRTILDIQDTVTSIERCTKPVIAAVHAACVGGGVDIIVACDLRYCSEDAWFSVKEIDIGVVADVGTLQRLPRLIGEGMTRELAYTGRRVSGAQAQALRLVNRTYDSTDELMRGVEDLARTLASKSPLALRGTKETITYARDHSVADALHQVATWNAATMFSADLDEAVRADAGVRGLSERTYSI